MTMVMLQYRSKETISPCGETMAYILGRLKDTPVSRVAKRRRKAVLMSGTAASWDLFFLPRPKTIMAMNIKAIPSQENREGFSP